jgi:hypothetical protein
MVAPGWECPGVRADAEFRKREGNEIRKQTHLAYSRPMLDRLGTWSIGRLHRRGAHRCRRNYVHLRSYGRKDNSFLQVFFCRFTSIFWRLVFTSGPVSFGRTNRNSPTQAPYHRHLKLGGYLRALPAATGLRSSWRLTPETLGVLDHTSETLCARFSRNARSRDLASSSAAAMENIKRSIRKPAYESTRAMRGSAWMMAMDRGALSAICAASARPAKGRSPRSTTYCERPNAAPSSAPCVRAGQHHVHHARDADHLRNAHRGAASDQNTTA